MGQGCCEAGSLNKMPHVPTKVGTIFRAVLAVSMEESPLSSIFLFLAQETKSYKKVFDWSRSGYTDQCRLSNEN